MKNNQKKMSITEGKDDKTRSTPTYQQVDCTGCRVWLSRGDEEFGGVEKGTETRIEAVST